MSIGLNWVRILVSDIQYAEKFCSINKDELMSFITMSKHLALKETYN